jgi:hypothetical protein
VKFATLRENIVDFVFICGVNEQTPYSIREVLHMITETLPQVIIGLFSGLQRYL